MFESKERASPNGQTLFFFAKITHIIMRDVCIRQSSYATRSVEEENCIHRLSIIFKKE